MHLFSSTITRSSVSWSENRSRKSLFQRCQTTRLSSHVVFQTLDASKWLLITDDDIRRAATYAENALRTSFKNEAVDLNSYLFGLNMVLRWRRPGEQDIARVTQLINKTNQFNLTTRRLNESDVRAAMAAPTRAVLQFRLVDRFGDNGVIAVVIGHIADDAKFMIDDWLMSCRVLGRQVEGAMLNVLFFVAREMGASRLNGVYRPTKRNRIVADLLARLGFATEEASNGVMIGALDLECLR